jgi:sec-independent protein translocase protein TatA
MGLNHLPVLLILGVVALIIFGPKRLPELGHGLGKAISEFRKVTSELTSTPATEAVAGTAPGAPVASPDPTTIANVETAPKTRVGSGT